MTVSLRTLVLYLRKVIKTYCPVSLTSLICKMFESIIRDAIIRHLEDNGLLRDSQHGFRKGRTCLTNLLTFMDKATGYFDSGAPVDAVFWILHKHSTKYRIVGWL